MKTFLKTFSLLSFLISLPFLILFWKRSQLSYNEQGVFFDEAASVVYHQQSVVVYAGLGFGLVVVSIILFLVGRKK